MSNFIKVTDAKQLDGLFENIQDKLIILMFFTKANPECKRALQHFERSASNHNVSYFLVIDMDKFKGESRYTKNAQQMPKFECYYGGNTLGSYLTSNDKEIEQMVQMGERYVMTTANMKNNTGGMTNNNNQMPFTNQFNPIQLQQVRNQIINNLQMTNPAQAGYLIQNPAMLNQMAQQQLAQQQMIQQQQQQQMMYQPQNQMPNQMPNQNQIPNQMQMAQQPASMPVQYPSTVSLQPSSNPTQSSILQNMAPTPAQSAVAASLLPTLQQMHQMFHIWNNMQQMGILNPSGISSFDVQKNNQSQSILGQVTTSPSTSSLNEAVVLPNGDKLVSLPDGKFGLIKSKK